MNLLVRHYVGIERMEPSESDALEHLGSVEQRKEKLEEIPKSEADSPCHKNKVEV